MAVASQAIERLTRSCQYCSLRYLCLPYGLDAKDLNRLDALLVRDAELDATDSLFAQGDRLQAIYAIREGSTKLVVSDQDGFEQILGFYYPGDLIGLDGFAEQSYQCTAIALEPTTVCRIPLERLDTLVDQIPSLRHQLMRLMGQALTEEEQRLLTLGRKNSEGRIASLLLSLSRRLAGRGMSAERVPLAMKRADMANFLSMRLETVSRSLTRLQRDGVIEIGARAVHIHDRQALCDRAGSGAWVTDQS